MLLKEHLGLSRERLQTLLLVNNRECVHCDDAKRRSGACSLERTYANWKRLTMDNQMELMANEKMKINVSMGSLTLQPVTRISEENTNN